MVRTLPWSPRRLPLCHLNLENRFPSCRTCVGLNLQPEPKPGNVSKSFSLHLVPYLAPAPRPLGAEGLAPHRTACPFLCPCPPDRAGPSGFPPWLPGPSRATDPNATTCRPFTRPWGPGGRPPLLLRWAGKQVLAPTSSLLQGRGVLGGRAPPVGAVRGSPLASTADQTVPAAAGAPVTAGPALALGSSAASSFATVDATANFVAAHDTCVFALGPVGPESHTGVTGLNRGRGQLLSFRSL